MKLFNIFNHPKGIVFDHLANIVLTYWSGNSYNNIRDIIVLYFKEFVVDISVVTSYNLLYLRRSYHISVL